MAIAAAYQSELSPHQVLYVSNQGEFTTLTIASRSAGQQQQSGSRFSTGQWTAAPVLHRLAQGLVVTISAAQETYYLQIQGGQSQISAGRTSDISAQVAQSPAISMQPAEVPSSAMPPMQPMEPTTPMQPMQPMKPMQMNANPMSMSMGDMEMSSGEMRMGNMRLSSTAADSASASASASASSEGADRARSGADAKVKRFCAQCGSAIGPGDRFCAHCGTSLQ